MFDFSHTRISRERSFFDYTRVQLALSAVLRNRKLQLRWVADAPYLNIGCGTNAFPGFVNSDWQWRPGYLCWDLRKPLPFADQSLHGIFTEHSLEHIPLQDAVTTLAEFRRVLKPGSICRIVVPDAELMFDLYARHKAGEQVEFPYCPTPLPSDTTPLLAATRIWLERDHWVNYDAETLGKFMRDAGFSDVRKCRFRQGANPDLLIDQPERAIESLYMEGRA